MKKEIEISAKTREEAIEKAVIELGAPSAAAIMYTVINEGRKGFLGFGAVDCTIKAVYQVPDAPAEEKPRRERREPPTSSRPDASGTVAVTLVARPSPARAARPAPQRG